MTKVLFKVCKKCKFSKSCQYLEGDKEKSLALLEIKDGSCKFFLEKRGEE